MFRVKFARREMRRYQCGLNWKYSEWPMGSVQLPRIPRSAINSLLMIVGSYVFARHERFLSVRKDAAEDC